MKVTVRRKPQPEIELVVLEMTEEEARFVKYALDVAYGYVKRVKDGRQPSPATMYYPLKNALRGIKSDNDGITLESYCPRCGQLREEP